MKIKALLILAFAISTSTVFAQTNTINTTEKAGLLDGSCGNDEWDAATKINLPGEAAIYVMHDKDYFYLCASGKKEDHTVLDLYIESAETSRTHKYHLSAQMGESILTDEGWKPASGKWKLKDYAGFWVPYSGLEDVENRKGPKFEKGTHRQMQISRKKFEGNTWNMMVGLSAVSHEGEGPINYPQHAKSDDKSTWAQFSFSKRNESQVKESHYFGQKRPGLIPEVFAPEIVRNAHGVSFSPDLDEIYFSASKNDEEASIYFSKLKGTHWTPIQKANFTNGKKKEELYPSVSLVDNRIYFTAFDSIFSDEKIWYIDRLEDSWSDARQLDSPINDDIVFYINQSKNGDLFYTSVSNGKMYRAPNQNDAFPEVKKIELEFGHHGFISPSQEYLIVYARNQEDEGRKDFDLYVCFKINDGTWTKPINLGDAVNTKAYEGVPSITPDGKFLFFDRSEEGKEGNIYWVSTEVIHKLKPDDLSTRDHSNFGQKPPGLIPQVFAPGIVSIDGRFEGGISFSPDLKEMYFGADEDDETHIYFSKLQGNQWTPIKRADFTKGKKKEELHPFVSPDGKAIYFTALDSAFADEKIWFVNRLEDSWSEAMLLDSPINDDLVFYPNQARNGDLYYFNLSKFKMYSAASKNGAFPETHEMGIEFGHHGFISPSQDYLLVTDRNKEDETRKDNDVYVYFKNQDGTWTKPINLGNTINTSFNEKSPSITPDGKYLFFGRDERDIEPGLSNIYWVDAQVIETLRPKQH